MVSDAAMSTVWSSCSVRFGTQVLKLILSLTGLAFNSMALVFLARDRELGRPFRVLLTSLSVSDLGFAAASLLTASVAIADSFLVTSQDAAPEAGHWSVMSTTCSLLTGAYHSLLAGGAATTLALSVDRLMAVFAPILYRYLGLTSNNRMSGMVLPVWLVALIFLVAPPVTWRFLGDRQYVEAAVMTCLPLVAVTHPLLVAQAVLLLGATVGVLVTHVCTIRKLTRRAILIFPLFGSRRSSDSTANERLQIRRSAGHAASQAVCFCMLYTPFAVYLLWLGAGDTKTTECHSSVVLLLLPATNNVINPLLTLWRLRNCPKGCPACCVRPAAPATPRSPQAQHSTAPPHKASRSHSHPVAPVGSILPSPEPEPEPGAEVRSEGVTGDEAAGHGARSRVESTGQSDLPWAAESPAEVTSERTEMASNQRSARNHSTSVGSSADPGPHNPATDQDVTSVEGSERGKWSAPRDNYNKNSSRADPSLLQRGSIGSTEHSATSSARCSTRTL